MTCHVGMLLHFMWSDNPLRNDDPTTQPSASTAFGHPIPRRYPLDTAAPQSDPPDRPSLEASTLSSPGWSKASPFAPSRIRDRAMHLYMSPYIALVRSSVVPHGGAVTFKFSQSKGAFTGRTVSALVLGCVLAPIGVSLADHRPWEEVFRSLLRLSARRPDAQYQSAR
jgi:hypothetical protein